MVSFPPAQRPTTTILPELGLFTRFVSRLPVGRKLLLIYLLVVSSVIYVSSILINKQYIAINFARKEGAGSAYVARIRDVLTELPVLNAPAPDGTATTSAPGAAELVAWRAALA